MTALAPLRVEMGGRVAYGEPFHVDDYSGIVTEGPAPGAMRLGAISADDIAYRAGVDAGVESALGALQASAPNLTRSAMRAEMAQNEGAVLVTGDADADAAALDDFRAGFVIGWSETVALDTAKLQA